jgi:hypothetical protein
MRASSAVCAAWRCECDDAGRAGFTVLRFLRPAQQILGFGENIWRVPLSLSRLGDLNRILGLIQFH